MKIIIETTDYEHVGRFIADVRRKLRVYSRNQDGSVGPALHVTSVTFDEVPPGEFRLTAGEEDRQE